MQKVVRVRDPGHRAALFTLCLLSQGSWLQPPLTSTTSPLSPTSTLPFSHWPTGPYVRNLRLNLTRWSSRSEYLQPHVWILWEGSLKWGSEKMRSMQRNLVTSSCHCSGVARSDSRLSAKALYGKPIHRTTVWLLTLPSHALHILIWPELLLISSWRGPPHT